MACRLGYSPWWCLASMAAGALYYCSQISGCLRLDLLRSHRELELIFRRHSTLDTREQLQLGLLRLRLRLLLLLLSSASAACSRLLPSFLLSAAGQVFGRTDGPSVFLGSLRRDERVDFSRAAAEWGWVRLSENRAPAWLLLCFCLRLLLFLTYIRQFGGDIYWVKRHPTGEKRVTLRCFKVRSGEEENARAKPSRAKQSRAKQTGRRRHTDRRTDCHDNSVRIAAAAA